MKENRKIYIMRHGERVDLTFESWITDCFIDSGVPYAYEAKDLNMPKRLPQKKNQPDSWATDSPITNIGYYQAKLIGEAMKDCNIQLDHIYSSPSYRCVQTCTGVLEALGIKDSKSINIEPGLFEWMNWYFDNLQFCTPDEFESININVNKNYKAFLTDTLLKKRSKETVADFYNRNSDVLEHLLNEHETGNIFLVGHAVTLDTCTRKFLGKPDRSYDEMCRVFREVPYCGIIEMAKIDDVWQISKPPFHSLTHSKNPAFNWEALL